ncbi:TetR/AcrR family transcriptional regulator [Frankia sp. CNm7]|uniref:TetR/AcrR family transcriptional regulator n=1 Tax=Frankia nepalensis TaxID=1836974 RepID=A0A937RHM6_9ACTN|nr:TetR/AcrR family transcriptional regulator [Frankia nepalensis]MBL7499708.1 TetR/AcrR family transcriptional regulator [Frankia nepalensis]MBL7515000.1 TetR/AcrR family transcriptional regulator [Frankia nepalensis]MBL7521983.1 TetR/AcrR family transcriptional regulator [Frankia nepalensis]MBL7629140.1 TetR/AcrR family transcriptional regulator [Frankia nepalensis]
MGEPEAGPGRAAQRRRTRKAIVDAATELVAKGEEPSVTDIARAADVSRRTIYTYFPSIEQLLLDATLGALSSTHVDAPMAAAPMDTDDPAARTVKMIDALTRATADFLPLGRKMIRLTVETPEPERSDDQPRRGYRRVEWIERALEPLRDRLGQDAHERLVSALTMIVGWEGLIVLRDVRGLAPEQERAVVAWAAQTLIDAALAESADTESADTDGHPPATG